MGGVEVSRAKKKDKKSKKKKKKKRMREEALADYGEDERGGDNSDAEEEEEAARVPEIVVLTGTGRISTSGMTVQGHEGTKFMRELRAGDAVVITHPTTLCDETRLVKMVLSDSSMGISSAFSSDLISRTLFRYVKAPEAEGHKERAAEMLESKKRKKVQDEDAAFGTYAGAGGTKFTYRERKKIGTGYLIKTEETGAELSRSELMEMRSKKKSDRMCM